MWFESTLSPFQKGDLVQWQDALSTRGRKVFDSPSRYRRRRCRAMNTKRPISLMVEQFSTEEQAEVRSLHRLLVAGLAVFFGLWHGT